ncbi:MAG: HEPN domain-containing protein [Firmicutes bacterium]|nr:HEPN domain-containing protein [Bacillota bacterium]
MDGLKQEDLARYRIESAEERLVAAKILMEKNLFKDAISRAYYSIFQATRAVLATKKLDAHKHSGVISFFNQHFVKSGIFSREFSKILKSARDLREAGDYDDFYLVTKEEAQLAIDNAEKFIKGVKEFLDAYYGPKNL